MGVGLACAGLVVGVCCVEPDALPEPEESTTSRTVAAAPTLPRPAPSWAPAARPEKGSPAAEVTSAAPTQKTTTRAVAQLPDVNGPEDLRALGKLDTPQAEAILLGWSGRSLRPDMQAAAALALLESARARVLPALWDRYQARGQYPASVRLAAFIIVARRSRVLGEGGWQARVVGELPALATLLEGARGRGLSPRQRSQVVGAIAEVGGQPALEALARLVRQGTNAIGQAAAAHLARSSHPRALEIARRLLESTRRTPRELLAQRIVLRLERLGRSWRSS